ncbi:hypothetical protein DTO271D3_8274 [Paecilomyces variotii]|nr:hypothetical protein DTO169E5_6195 [Paecilomyces variotii]KAJ9255885.1 hypothetical protein DTO207G8_2902 [Paecilomyces variotii]KAJ9306455.1 hypothetical protein DTO217A2_4001 [Paecilomyces variotii]KAJ9311474.1 hypothetical protein DTO271D3_8274 [Paecilomyces variotii]
MSAPRGGRQSPDPERQSGAQLQEVPGSGHTRPEQAPSPEHAQKSSNETKEHGLESNPVHPLEKIEAEKFSKKH